MIKRYLPRRDENNTLGIEIVVKNNEIVTVNAVQMGLRNRTEKVLVSDCSLTILAEPFKESKAYTSRYGHGQIISRNIIRIVDTEDYLKVTLNPEGNFGFKSCSYFPRFNICG